MNRRALIAMSGGVDSSVAALLMRDAGFECTGATMKLFSNADAGIPRERGCCSLEDVEDARSVAFRLGIPYYVFNFSDAFQEKVMQPFADAYEHGRTPNPCVECNRALKFDKLMHRARELDIGFVATGHYARIAWDEARGRYLLKRAADASKDQSYVLYMLTQAQLAHLKLPIGDLTKAQVRQIALEHGFLNARKRDSQDICFVPDGDYCKFIRDFTHRAYPEGDFIDLDGRVLGRHRGIIHYTIGQRKGLGIACGRPLYVAAIDPENNTVTLADDAALYRSDFAVGGVNLISVDRIEAPVQLSVKIRYAQPACPATVVQTGDDELQIHFLTPQRAIAKGQSAVLYDGDTVVGGGTIL